MLWLSNTIHPGRGRVLPLSDDPKRVPAVDGYAGIDADALYVCLDRYSLVHQIVIYAFTA